MRNLTLATSLVLAAAALAACADQPTTPSARSAGPSLSSAAACAASPTAVVSTDAELRAAVAAAQPGDVIAISGTIILPTQVTLTTPGITLTCAGPGAGLQVVEGSRGVLLEIAARDITVTGLHLDAEYAFGAIVGFNVFDEDFSGIRVTHNNIGCGYTVCVFFVGTQGTHITDNHFEGDSTNTGIQFQAPYRDAAGIPINPPDDVVISRNVMETEDSYPSSIYGAIRVRDGSNATITHNDVGYGWTSGIVLTNVFNSRVEHNRINGALNYGIAVAEIVSLPVTLRGVSFTGNQVSHSGIAAMSIARACGNVFTGNNVQGNDRGAVFLASTGANVWRGNPGVVEDGGSFDCDGDGSVDPNQITGTSVAPGASFAPAAHADNGRFDQLR
ncbi:MAG TPA: right-handed parallel beta-helix repeat-containing protein [Longimicrobium sp.]|nr:right-handed parallel beta-helix repeat-containing protein [Longimicrobium sp.]